MADSLISLLFQIGADGGEAQREILDTKQAVAQVVRESNADLGTIGAGLEGGSLRARLRAGLGNVRELFSGISEGARTELEGAGGIGGIFTRMTEQVKTGSGEAKQSLAGLLDGVSNLRQGFSGGVGGIVEQFASNLGRAASEGRNLATAIPPATLAAGALAAGVAAAGAVLIKGALEAAEFAGRLQDVSDEIGFSVQLLGQLEAAGKVAGVSFSTISSSITGFQDKLDDALSGNKKLAAEFRALGIEVKKAADDPQAAYLQLLRSLGGVENQAQKTALAKDLLGKSGLGILRVTEELVDENGKLRKEYEELAAALSGENVAALDTLGDEWARFQVRAQTALVSITAQYAPDLIIALRDIGNALGDAQNATGGFGEVASNVFGAFIILAREAKYEISQIVEGLFNPDIAEGIKQIGRGIVGNFEETRRQYLEEREKLRKEFAAEDEKDNKRTPRLNIPRGGGKAGDDAARNRLRQLEAELKEEEAIYRLSNEALRRSFDERALDEQEYTERLLREAELRRQTTLDTLIAERAVVNSSKLKPADKTKELESIARREREIERETAAERARIDSEAQKRRDEQSRRLNEAQLETERAGLARQRALIQGALADRVLSFEAAERALSEIADREMRLRITNAEAEVINAVNNAEEKAIAQEKVNALIVEGRALEEASLRRIADARVRDLAELRAYAEAQRQLRRQLQSEQVAAAERAAEQIERRAQVRPGLRDEAIDARAAAQQAALQLEHTISLQRLADQRAEQLSEIQTAEVTTETLARIFEAEQTFNDLRLAEEQRFADERARIRAEQAQQQAALDPLSNQSLFGVNDESLSRLDAIGTSIQDALSKGSAAAGNFGTIMNQTINATIQGLGQMVSAMILTGSAGPAAFKKLAVGVIAAVAQMATVKAVFELAEGFAALARSFFGDPKAAAEAALHFKSAAIYGAIAAVAGGIGAAAGGAGGAGGPGGGGGSSAGSEFQRDADRQREPEESRFRRGDVTGQIGAPDRQVTIIGFMLEMARRQTEEQQRAAEAQRALYAQHLAATERNVEATEALASRISSMPPEEVLSTAVARAPELIAEGVGESLIRSPGFTRGVAESLRLE